MFTAHVNNAAIAGADLRIPLGNLPGSTLEGISANNTLECLPLLHGGCPACMRTEIRVSLFGLRGTSVELYATNGACFNFSALSSFSGASSGAGKAATLLQERRCDFVLLATDATGQKSTFIHTLDYTRELDVIKPYLIDLEAQAWATGGKVTATAYRPERLSDGDAIERMRQSGLPYNAESKRERKVEAPSRHGDVVTKVTDCKYYSGYEELDINPSDVMTAAEYNWKQSACVVSASGLEAEVQNSGKEAKLNLVEKRIKNAFRTMKNQTSVGIYSDGTGYSSKQITGLQAQVANDPTTGTVGGINRATWTFWRNKYNSNATWTSAVIKGYMKNLYTSCTRGTDMPDLVTMDANTYEIFWDALTDIQRVNHEKDKATMGWQNIAFQNADVIYDGDSGHPANTLYMLNTDYLFFRPHVNRNFVHLEKRDSVNQDAYVVPIVFAGNLTMSNASLQGVYFKS